MIKDRILSFVIDVFLLKFFISLAIKNTPINSNLGDIIFLLSYSGYYIFSNIILKKTFGKRLFNLKSAIEGENDKKRFILNIIIKYLFILPVIVVFTDFKITIHWSEQNHQGITIFIPAIYYVYLVITDKFLHDKFTKIKVVKE